MAVTLKVTGNGNYKGSETNLTSYSASEESTPVSAADTTGGTGQLNFGVVADNDTILLLNDTLELQDGTNGRVQGTVNSVSVSDGMATVSADSRLNALVGTVVMPPFVGSLGSLLLQYLAKAGINSGYVIDSSLSSRTVRVPGWEGDLWDNLKQLAVAERFEISLVSSNIVFRPLRGRTAELGKNTTMSQSVSNDQLAQFVEVTYYNNTNITSGMVYPKDGWTEDMQVFQIDAGQTTVFEVPINVSLSSVFQPQAVDFVGRTDDSPAGTSVYTVAGNDGRPIKAAQWEAQGGSLTVRIGADTKTLIFTLKGARGTQYAPYSIAMTAGSSDYYSSVRIRGSGVTFEPQVLRVPTGTPDTKTAQEVGITVENPYISTLSQAFTQAVLVAGGFASPKQTVTFSSTLINRRGQTGHMRYPTFGDFNSDWAPGSTFADFELAWPGTMFSFADFNAYYFAKVSEDFENQVFGNAGGARLRVGDAWYRIRSATVTEAITTATAESDTLFSDFNSVWSGATFADFSAEHMGRKFQDFAVIPLRKTT